MVWEEELFALFDDLEAQAEALYAAERSAELEDRARAEYAAVTWASRLMASVDSDLALEVRGVGNLQGRLERVGDGWCLLRSAGRHWIVPASAVLTISGASSRSTPELAWSVVARLGLGSALRRLGDAAAPCVVHLISQARHEGTVGRVGRDFVEIWLGERVGDTLIVPLDAIGAVSSSG